jgi:DNA-binding MarR family transcriptional regulator
LRRGGRPPIERPDQVVGQHVRRRMMVALSSVESLSFSELLAITGTSSGGLSLHAQRLERFGYITIEKMFVGRTPQTTYRLTAAGREALETHRTPTR